MNSGNPKCSHQHRCKSKRGQQADSTRITDLHRTSFKCLFVAQLGMLNDLFQSKWVSKIFLKTGGFNVSQTCVSRHVLHEFLSRELVIVAWKVRHFKFMVNFCVDYSSYPACRKHCRKLKSPLKIFVVLILGKPFLSFLHLQSNSECGILNIKSYCSSWNLAYLMSQADTSVVLSAKHKPPGRYPLENIFLTAMLDATLGLIIKHVHHRDWIKAKVFVLLIPF